jgi:DNA-directed RNA polymerase specialized sigma24 family protein
MVNPFTEVVEGHVDDIDLVERARNGGRALLEELILRHQAWIYNIALRMVQKQHDAEEVTQEVLV